VTPSTRPRVLIIGCGFGGLEAARSFGGADVEVTVIDRTNHHLFQPLLYQVATAGLSAPAIAAPVRHLFRKQENVTTLLGDVVGIDAAARLVRLADGAALDEGLAARIRSAVRDHASPRHVPDEVLRAPAIPHTVTGKKLEVPVKRVLQGVPADQACDLGAVDDPGVLRWFADLAARRRAAGPR